jgi:ABC-type uncharacterized transport system auxiliary subunit
VRKGAAPGLAAALLAAVVGVACAGPARTPAMVYYTLAVPGAPDRALPGPVAVGVFTADAAYATPRLVYRSSPFRIQYYVFHRWAAGSPQAAVATAVGDYLSRAAGPADGPPTRIGGTLRRIEEVDEAGHRRGVLAIDFRVERNGKPWLERSYQESEPADADTPEAVVAALSRALGRMLDRLLADLLAAPPPGAALRPARRSARRPVGRGSAPSLLQARALPWRR